MKAPHGNGAAGEYYVKDMAAAGRSPITQKLRRHQITFMADSRAKPVGAITRDDLTTWFASHHEWVPETRHSYTVTCRLFLM